MGAVVLQRRQENMRIRLAHPWLHGLVLLLWTIAGLGLRLINLTGKPLWTDEFSTIVFSLGNSFLTVPLDQILNTEQLLQPLRPNLQAGVETVVQHLLQESNHPPLYFILTHFWLKLFPAPDGWVSVWGVRSLSVLFGTLAIPATFGLAWLAFRSLLVGHLAAVFMTVSPFGIYLAQEARHYTLPLIWIIASLGCLIVAARAAYRRRALPVQICLIWVTVNTLAIATHYLTMLPLVAEAIVLLGIGAVQSWQEQGRWYPSSHWWRIVAVAAGTMMGGLVWLPYLQDVPDSNLTAWILQGGRKGLEWLDPIAQALAAWISMLYLLPIQAVAAPIVIASGVALLLLLLWTLPKLYRGLKLQEKQSENRFAVMILGCFVLSTVGLFFTITYLFDRDLTSALRYNFVYFPAVMVLMGAALAPVWLGEMVFPPQSNAPKWLHWLYTGTVRSVVLIALFSLLGGVTVVANLGYQKVHRPDIVAQDIRANAQGNANVLVAIPHETHGQTGRMMAIAWALQQIAPTAIAAPTIYPRFLLAQMGYDSQAIMTTLRQALRDSPRPLELWLVNFRNVPDKPIKMLLERQDCEARTDRRSTDGYTYQLYRCEE